MIKDEESSSLTRRYYRCKQSETGVFWGGRRGRASTCDARDTGAKEGSGGRGDGQRRGDCLLLSPLRARSKTNLLLAGLDTEWVEYMVQVLLIHYWAFKIFICTNPI